MLTLHTESGDDLLLSGGDASRVIGANLCVCVERLKTAMTLENSDTSETESTATSSEPDSSKSRTMGQSITRRATIGLLAVGGFIAGIGTTSANTQENDDDDDDDDPTPRSEHRGLAQRVEELEEKLEKTQDELDEATEELDETQEALKEAEDKLDKIGTFEENSPEKFIPGDTFVDGVAGGEGISGRLGEEAFPGDTFIESIEKGRAVSIQRPAQKGSHTPTSSCG